MADQNKLAQLILSGQSNQDPRTMSWSDLAALRAQNANNPQVNQGLAPYEHRAYSREAVQDNPLMAIPYSAMVPGYQLAKLAGFQMGDGGQTPPSMNQLAQGYAGIYDGLVNRLRQYR